MGADQAVLVAETLQDLEDAGWELEHLESRHSFDRYSIGCGITFWACPDCGSIEADPTEGCEACGYATADATADEGCAA
jgi:rubrerythrin